MSNQKTWLCLSGFAQKLQKICSHCKITRNVGKLSAYNRNSERSGRDFCNDILSYLSDKWQLVIGKISIQSWAKFLYEQDFFCLAVVISFSGRENLKMIPLWQFQQLFHRKGVVREKTLGTRLHQNTQQPVRSTQLAFTFSFFMRYFLFSSCQKLSPVNP